MSQILLLDLILLLYTLQLPTGFYSHGVTVDVHWCSIHAQGPSEGEGDGFNAEGR